MPIGKNDVSAPYGHTKSPGVAAPGLFYSVLWRGGLIPQAGYTSVLHPAICKYSRQLHLPRRR